MELQYKIDDLSSRIDGWKASFEGHITDVGSNVSSPEDVAIVLAASTERQDKLSSEVARLEEKILRMTEDQRQQSKMHKAIAEGLEIQCEMLSDENADMCDEVREKCDYISALEEAKKRSAVNLDLLKKECEEKCRRLCDLEKSSVILRKQKEASEKLRDEIVSEVQKLASVAIVHSEKLEGFSSNLATPSTWSENLEYVAQFIEHASKMNQKYVRDLEQAQGSLDKQHEYLLDLEQCKLVGITTPKATSRNVDSLPSVMNFASQRSDMLEDLKDMKNALANVMASPKLTPLKSGRQEERHAQENDKYDEDLYSDLLRAHEQLESFSKKIVALQDEQRQWGERETHFQSRITGLEEENQNMKKTQPAEQAKQMEIAKEMAKELAQTRKKVLMLKSHFDRQS